VATELAPCCKKTLPGQCFVGHEKFDLLWHGKKIAGAAQRRSKLGLLIQGSVQPPQPDLLRGDWERGMRSAATAFLSGLEKNSNRTRNCSATPRVWQRKSFPSPPTTTAADAAQSKGSWFCILR
jgi:hypothetical protein